MRPIFKTEMLMYHSKANLDEKTLFGKITHHLGSEIWAIKVRSMFWEHGLQILFWSLI